MRTEGLAPMLRAMGSAVGPDTGLPVTAIADRSGLSVYDVRAGLRSMLQLEPSWVDADVRPQGGLSWWLTATGRQAAVHAGE